MKRKEYTAKDFSWMRWTAEEIANVGNELLQNKREAFERIKSIAPENRTFENTVYAIEHSSHDVWKLHAINLLMNVSSDPKIRDAAQATIDRVEKAMVDIEYDDGIYATIKEYDITKEVLDNESAKLYEDMLREYRRMGFDLSLKDRTVVKENLKRLSELSSQFSKNINEYEGSILVTREELDGLSENYIANLKKRDGKYVVSLDYPELNPFLENATVASKRKELAEKNLQKGGLANVAILEEVVKLRHNNANILGYANHAEFRLEVKMAKNATTVFDFMSDLMEKMREGLAYDMNALKALKKRRSPNDGDEVSFYDIAFLVNEFKKEHWHIDTQKVSEYFPLQKVLQGMFEVYEQLFSIRFEKVTTYPVWHKDVEAYAVRELSGDIIAYFLLDLYPREGKYGHAAVFEVITGHREDFSGSDYVTPVACMVANFSQPNQNHPSLLHHSEVVTLFHEFGHVMHETLTKARYRSQAGFNVAWDFAEAPSQMLENWAWNKEVLTKIAGHFQTGEALPQEMMNNMIRSKNCMVAYAMMRQMTLSLFDMALHAQGVEGELNEEYAQMTARYTGITLPQDHLFLAGWGHLMGYDAGYYGYMWALVYATDMFTRFEKEGVLNPETGKSYREWILEKGSSQDEATLVEGFLGRKLNKEAFLHRVLPDIDK